MKSSSDFFTLELKDLVENGIEQTSRVFYLVQCKCVLEFKLLTCAFFLRKEHNTYRYISTLGER